MSRLPAYLCLTPLALAAASQGAQAQSSPLVDVCSGLTVNLPVLQPVSGVASGLLAGLLDPVLNVLVGDVNLKLRDALSGRNIGVSVLDTNGNLVSVPGNCRLQTGGVRVFAPGGIAIGGGEITGLGGANPTASAADANAIAFGNGAATNAAATAGIALGLRSSVTGADGIALGRDAAAQAAGGIAIGAGSVALRTGLAGGTEAFGGTAVASTQGAVSVGSAGGERQITNLAGGTQATDAVNLRQLRSVANNAAATFGGGASYDANGSFTGPSYTLRGGVYTDVGTALAALDLAIDAIPAGTSGVVAGNNTSSLPNALAGGADALAAGYGASATASGGVALGSGSVAQRAGLSGARESFSGTAVASVQGAVSFGSAGNERQVTHVAGGTQDTDAVNLRQLRSVANNSTTALGGGAGYDVNGNFTGPSYALRGGIYTNVGSALAALDRSNGAVDANNASNAPAASAIGTNALAAGYGSSATGAQSTALGSGAVASGQGSVALGSGAVASRAGQVALGTVASTYTMPGLASAASRAAQSGPVQVVTTDASGNLAAVPVDIAGLDQRIGALGSRVDRLEAYARESRREARQGVAAAMAMTNASMPSSPGRTSWSGSTATFKGEWAAGFAVAHRFNVATPVAFNAAVSLAGNTFGGARVGLNGEF